MFEDEKRFFSELEDATQFYIDVVKNAASGDAGNAIRSSVLLSDEALEMARNYIMENQLWENQIDMEGKAASPYAPSTIKKKLRIGFPPDKLVNYTQKWTGAFYERGIKITVNIPSDTWEIENTLAQDYFGYIPDRYIGLTEENYEPFVEALSRTATQRQIDYINREIESSQYSALLKALTFVGYDFV